jgi:acetylglutamate kinase
MRLLVKVGGAQLEQPAAREALARSLAAARRAGHELVVVHGGGNQIRALCAALGIAERSVSGLRVTDERTADVVLLVLAGQVNRELVQALGRAGLPAVGLSGADGGLFAVKKHRPVSGADLGYVGEVARVDARPAEVLLRAGYVPVIATVAPLAAGEDAPDDRFYNVNADMAVAPLAAAFACDAVVFLTDVPGVLDAAGELVPALDPVRCRELRASGVIRGGMIPKVESALAALAAAPRALVKIAPAGAESAVLAALAPAHGTRFLPSL